MRIYLACFVGFLLTICVLNEQGLVFGSDGHAKTLSGGVTLKSGEVVQGQVVYDGDGYYKLRRPDGSEKIVYKYEIKGFEQTARQMAAQAALQATNRKSAPLSRNYRIKNHTISLRKRISPGRFFIFVVLQGIASITGLVGQIWLIVLAFQTRVLWGVISLIVPGGSWVFGMMNWQRTSTPVLLSVGGFVAYVLVMFSAGFWVYG